MKRMKSGGGWKAIAYTLRMANRVGWWRLWKAMSLEKRLQDVRAGHGRAGRRHAQRGRTLAGSLQEIAASDGRRHAERTSTGVLRALQYRRVAHAVAARTGMVRPHHDAAVCRAGGHALSRRRLGGSTRSRRSTAARASRPTENFFYASGRSSNEAGFLLQLFARLYGTNYVNNCSYYCHQASGVGLGRSLGTGTATVTLDDVEKTDLFVLIGGNPASNHPRLMRTADDHSPPRRTGHRHQPRQGNRPRQFQRAVRSCAVCCSARRSPVCTCSRTSAATSRS